jgi:hypothetical protein
MTSTLLPIMEFIDSPKTQQEAIKLILSFSNQPALFTKDIIDKLLQTQDTHDILTNISAHVFPVELVPKLEEKAFKDHKYITALANVTRNQNVKVNVGKCIDMFAKEQGEYMGYVLTNVTRVSK